MRRPLSDGLTNHEMASQRYGPIATSMHAELTHPLRS